MNALLHTHSGLRYIVLILLLLAIIKSFTGLKRKSFSSTDKKIALFGMVSCHIQILIGFILYFANGWYSPIEGFMKNSYARFFSMEHVLMMIIGVILITIGYSKSKKAISDKQKFKKIAVFYTIGLVIILAAIPWPFREALKVQGWF